MASSAKERFHTFNTLSVLLIAMHGRKVVVETTNDSTITGKVMQSDGFGNLWLANATLATINGKKTRFHEIHVKVLAINNIFHVFVNKYIRPEKTNFFATI